MKNVIFVQTAMSIFNDIKISHQLNLTINNDVLTYSNDQVSFSLYFERLFEIYCCFDIKNNSMRLIDIATVMQVDESDIRLLSHNQVSDDNGILFVLTNLHSFLRKFLNRIILQQDVILAYWQETHQVTQRKNENTKRVLTQLQDLWATREFSKFVELYNQYQLEIVNTMQAKKIAKQAEYAKRRGQGQGDGLREPY